jgi:hypothetical protein
LCCSPLLSQLEAEERFVPLKKGLISVGAGIFNITRTHMQWLAEIEYKWKPVFFELRPQVGFFITDCHATYFYGGISYDIMLPLRLVLTPSFCPGLYFKGDRGKNLGYPLEFRSCLELSFRFVNENRIGAKFYHISNASLGSHNPGANNFVLFVAF